MLAFFVADTKHLLKYRQILAAFFHVDLCSGLLQLIVANDTDNIFRQPVAIGEA